MLLTLSLLDQRVLIQRAKVSHSWLDHEIALVSPATAVRRWQDGDWGRLGSVFESFYRTGTELGDRMLEFSSAEIVDILTPLYGLAKIERDTLKQRLRVIFRTQVDVESLRTEYCLRLKTLWDAICTFRHLIDLESACVDQVAASWVEVQIAGADLKLMFAENLIPRGIVLP